jgi:hypothetical protein
VVVADLSEIIYKNYGDSCCTAINWSIDNELEILVGEKNNEKIIKKVCY